MFQCAGHFLIESQETAGFDALTQEYTPVAIRVYRAQSSGQRRLRALCRVEEPRVLVCWHTAILVAFFAAARAGFALLGWI